MNTKVRWIRKVRFQNNTAITALPKSWVNGWKLSRHSEIEEILQEDGSILIRPTSEELKFQKDVLGRSGEVIAMPVDGEKV